MKYILGLLLLVIFVIPTPVRAVQSCSVPSDKIDAYNECQQAGVPDCDKLYRTECREVSTSNIDSVFGVIKLPSQIAEIPRGAAGINQLIRVAIDLIFVIGIVSCLFFVLWGAVDYISSGSKKEGAADARKKITYALVGLVLLGLSFVIVRLVGTIVGLESFFKF